MASMTRLRHLKRLASLRRERSTYIDHWRELADHIHPRRGRFLASDRNKGHKRNDKIINSAPRAASRVMAAGMMAGITSPARPWFRLSTPDPQLAEYGPVRQYLHVVEEQLRVAFLKSNIYTSLHNVYLDLGFGTSVLHVEDHRDRVLRGYVFPLGQYCLANNAELRVDTLYREFGMTVGQMVGRFGEKSVSPRVRDLFKRHDLDEWIEVVHYIGPNDDQVHGRDDAKGMPWQSMWMEAQAPDETAFLRVQGYHEFPSMVARWELTGEDVYGDGPGMDALGDIKALQLYEKRKAMLIDKLANPPMKGPPNLRRGSLLPGDLTNVDMGPGGQSFEPAQVVNPAAIQAVREGIYDHEKRIQKDFFADLWLALTESDGKMTATEVRGRHEEKLLMLGPVLTRLEDDLYNPLIDRGFGILNRAGRLPRPPPELEGQDLKVEYTSIMAEAQKLLRTAGVERLAAFTAGLVAVHEDVKDKVNWDEMVDTYADSVGVQPNLINSDEKVAELRAARAQQAQAQAQGEAMAAAAAGAKDLAGAQVEDTNALGMMINGLGVAGGMAEGGGLQ